MPEHVAALIIGFGLALACVLIVTFFNDRYTRREKHISNLLLKRAKKE